MTSEVNSLNEMKVWKLVKRKELINGAKVLGTRWVLKNKLGDQNQILKRKARFVVKGYLQEYGRDYFETHAPVAKMKSVKLILSIAARRDYELQQLDFDTAFLNAPVEEDIYVEPPEGFQLDESGDNIVLKLLKALYGLKQAPRQWHKTIDEFMRSLGWNPLRSDICVYIKTSRTNQLMILSLYVDDTVICFHVNDKQEWFHDKELIRQRFAIKDLGECYWILNMKVSRDRSNRTITLSQQAFIERLCKLYGNEEMNRVVATPMINTGLGDLPTDNSEPSPLDFTQASLYRSLVGAMLYAANVTRVDIAYAIGLLCRYSNQPCVHHLQAARRVLKYLEGTANYCLIFGQHKVKAENPIVEVYCDANWGDKWTGKSTTGCVTASGT
jgi:hypothetical protein